MMSTLLFRRNKRNRVMAILIMTAFCLVAVSPASAIEPVNKTSDGIAIKGYDPVAYFAQGKPVKGNRDLEYVWMGAKWHFSSAEHRDLFSKDPGKYAPKYGGY